MNEIQINEKTYYTNLEGELLNKCLSFYSDGCQSYAISFGNNLQNVIQNSNIEGHECLLLKGFNYKKCIVPESCKDIKDWVKMLERGIDLIELL